MDSLNLNKNVCRICLDHKVILNWNDQIFEFGGTSYKDCYYKYTHLDKSDLDCYPKNLCGICAEELRNAHFLFEKALESFNFLQFTFAANDLETKYSDMEMFNSQPNMKRQMYTSNEIKSVQLSEVINPVDDQFLVEHLSNVCDNDSIIESENAIDNSKEISIMSGSIVMEPTHFIDIKNFQSSDETLLEQNTESCDELPKSTVSKYSKRRNKCQSLPKTANGKKLNEISNTKLAESSDDAENERNNCESPSQSLLKQKLNEKCETSSSPNQTSKKRRKYLICQYCSLKVEGKNQLKRHEAQHSKSRKRTETCPQCGVKLYTKAALNGHMQIHKENRQKNQKCEFCEKAFFNKGALNVHRRIHLGLMVKCPICSKEYYRQVDVDKHLLTHSATPVERNVGKVKYSIQCQYCNKSVLSLKWREHKAAHLGQPEVKCKICDKNFFSRQKCVQHLKRLHRKTRSEYQDLIHYYVAHNSRMSHLKIQQDEKVQPLIE